jgi:polyferredoxin
VRWTSQAELADPVARPKLLRTRTVLYPLALAVVVGLFALALTRRGTAEVTLLRAVGSPFTVDAAGEVTNSIRLRIHNRSTAAHRYTLTAVDVPELRLVAPELPLAVAAGEWRATTLFAVAPRAAIANGRRAVTLRIDDGQGFFTDHRFNLLGPGSR